ncbi:gamma-glutamyltransferase family protein [Salinicola peritrichatus]|uniref:gamma-glutamyltransferase family protein n=1 Tax=Salinicola peritrichatus TaxID=1267424 RepID=UPI000DA23EE1|nr:gamma-glutamyltransferase [Salinicola peritrichatus]
MTMTFTHRPILMSERGMVVSGHHQASEAGAAVLRQGGNAFDAAAAAAATLAVAVPHMNGLGGDAIALAYHAESDETFAINGSGRSPQAATVEAFHAMGNDHIDPLGPLAITVPGAPHAWNALLERFGSLSLGEALTPAITLAEQGVPIDTVMQTFLDGPMYRKLVGRAPELGDIYGVPGFRPLGERIRQTQLANTLRALANDGIATLYGGDVGRILCEDLRAAGSWLTLDDLSNHDSLIIPSLSVDLGQRRLHVAPPNSQGIALAALAGLWEADKRRRGPQNGFTVTDYLRLRSLAFAERDAVATDPSRSPLQTHFLDATVFDALLGAPATLDAESRAGGGDTSTLVVIDRWGNAVSWVQSLFEEFGSGVISPRTGIVMHNRLYLESLDDDPIHGLRPGLRPFHTLCPALLIGDGCDLAIATPGDHGQPQAIFQVIANLYERGFNLQQAIEAPRLRHDTGREVLIEDRAPAEWYAQIEAAGLTAKETGSWSRLMGGVNAIQRGPDGVLFGGADPRRACYAISA